MDDRRDIREGVENADDTGLIAGEQLITQAETLLPLEPASIPRDALHAALPDNHGGHAAIETLHGEFQKPSPDANAIEQHVGALRAIPELEALVTTWWEDPKTQRFVGTLGQIGL